MLHDLLVDIVCTDSHQRTEVVPSTTILPFNGFLVAGGKLLHPGHPMNRPRCSASQVIIRTTSFLRWTITSCVKISDYAMVLLLSMLQALWLPVGQS